MYTNIEKWYSLVNIVVDNVVVTMSQPCDKLVFDTTNLVTRLLQGYEKSKIKFLIRHVWWAVTLRVGHMHPCPYTTHSYFTLHVLRSLCSYPFILYVNKH